MTKVDLIAKVAAEAELTKKDAEKLSPLFWTASPSLEGRRQGCSCRLRHV